MLLLIITLLVVRFGDWMSLVGPGNLIFAAIPTGPKFNKYFIVGFFLLLDFPHIFVCSYFPYSTVLLSSIPNSSVFDEFLFCCVIFRYILASKIENKPDDYIFVYYRGRNDAWDGYGGAVVYTRSSVLPESIVPELEAAAKSVGRDFSTFIRTDNTCGPEPPLVERLEKKIEEGERTIVREVEEIESEVEKEVEVVEKTEMNLFQKLLEGLNLLKQDEENFLKSLTKEEMEVFDKLKWKPARSRDFSAKLCRSGRLGKQMKQCFS